MLVHRRENVPSMPESLRRLGETIHLFGTIRGFYRGQCEGQDGSIALIFINEDDFLFLGIKLLVLYPKHSFQIKKKKPPNHPSIKKELKRYAVLRANLMT